MKITVNGQSKEMEENLTVANLLVQFQVQNERVAVEWNGQILNHESFAEHLLKDGDVVEIVRFVGGG